VIGGATLVIGCRLAGAISAIELDVINTRLDYS